MTLLKPMQFKEFSEYLEKIESTSGRTDMTKIVVELLGQLKGDEIKYAMYLLQGRLVPKFISLEFNFSQKLILRALSNLATLESVKNLYAKYGDTGLVAQEVNSNYSIESTEIGLLQSESLIKKDMSLNIEEVYSKLKDIAQASGKGSQEEKIRQYLKLVLSVDPLSAKYLTRIIVGTIRLGISDKTVLDAVSWYKAGDKSLRSKLDYAFGKRADIGELTEIVLESKENLEELLENIKVKPGFPIASKLVEREVSSAAVWERMPNCFVQPKLDGLRGQLHYSEKNFEGQQTNSAIFSRNMETMTDQFPELTESLASLGVDSIILDSEIIGFNEENDEYLTYQETMQRKRKYDIGEYSKNIPVRAMCFDILFLNGEDLTQKPIQERIEILHELLEDSKSNLRMLETKQVESEGELEEYFCDKVENGLEGIITKQLDTTYEPGSRNFKWIKLKANTRSDLVDTIDVVVLGYYTGRGDRARFGFGTLLAGVYDPAEEKYYSIGKVGSGFSEELMTKMYLDMQKFKVLDKPENVVVEKTLFPDTWVEPKIIMEIIADEITRSPAHTAARGRSTKVKKDDPTKGLSIRFPRMKIWNREDKSEPNSIDEIVRMYELRKGSENA